MKKQITIFLSLLFFASCGFFENLEVVAVQKLDDAMASGEFDYVVVQSGKYLESHPYSATIWNLRGWAYSKLEDAENAEICFKKALKFEPKFDNAYVGLGSVYRLKGDLKQARNSYLKAIEIVPENSEAYGSLLVIELIEGNYEQAVQCGEKSWSLRKDNGTLAANLSIAYHYIGNYDKRDYFYGIANRLNYHNLKVIDEIFNGERFVEN